MISFFFLIYGYLLFLFTAGIVFLLEMRISGSGLGLVRCLNLGVYLIYVSIHGYKLDSHFHLHHSCSHFHIWIYS
jgi:hypothetical protein